MMKKLGLTGALCAGLFMTPVRTQAQVEIIGEILKRVIMAIDLRVQKAQTQTVVLQEAQQQLENILQETRLADITDWVQQQKDLYEEFYQELWQVKNALKYYAAIKEMIDKEAQLVRGYEQAYAATTKDRHFTAEEVGSIVQVYQGMLRQGASTIDQLNTLINGFTTQMDDGDRLQLINELSASVDRNLRQLESFTQRNILLSLQRAKDEQDLNRIKTLYGIQ